MVRFTRWLVVLLGLLGAGCRSAAEDEVVVPPLVVGCDFTNAPFAFREGVEPPYGRDVEMTRALAARIGRPLMWEQLPFDELLDAVEAGRVDAVVATMGVTAERAARVEFTAPYFETAVLAVVRAEDRSLTLGGLDGEPVAAGLGTTSERAVEKRLPASRIAAATEKGGSSVERLLAGEVRAAIMDGPDAQDLVREDSRLAILSEPLAAERYSIAVRPDAPELVTALDAALEALRAEGVLRELDERFGLTPLD